MNIVEIIIAIGLISYLIYGIKVLNLAKVDYSKVNQNDLDLIPSMFTTIGILGTFGGIAYGLWFFEPTDIENSIPTLLKGLKTAFFASIFGIALSIVFSKRISFIKNKNEKGVLSDETKAINKLIEAIEELRNDFSTTDDNGNKIKAGNLFRDIYKESSKQSSALQTFSSDLALTISAGFEEILNNPSEGVVAELKLVKAEIETLGNKLKDPTTDMTQSIVKELQESMGKMIEEFKTSMSGDTKNEMENMAKLLGQAGSSLTDFPMKLQNMTDNLNENFRGLQDVVKQISQQTLSQSEDSSKAMKKQVEEMSEMMKFSTIAFQTSQQKLIKEQSENTFVQSEQSVNFMRSQVEEMSEIMKTNTIDFQKSQLTLIKEQSDNMLSQSERSITVMRNQVEEVSDMLKNKVGELQSGQQSLLTEQSKNLQVSESLLSAFNTSIQSMNGLSVGVTQSISKLNEAQQALTSTISNFRNASQEINTSSSKFGESQLLFSKHSNEFLRNNSSTIDEIQKSLIKAKDVSADYAEKFEIIERGLQGIFSQIQIGLEQYKSTVGKNLETILGEYTQSLTKATESLASATELQSESIKDLEDEIKRLKS